MITQVTLRYFKGFADQSVALSDVTVLAGPNNSRKSTLLQAIAVWNLAIQKWRTGRRSSAKDRTGIPITRKDFTAIPLREMNLLWTDRDTAYRKNEAPGTKGGEPKPISIRLTGQGKEAGSEWDLTVNLRYQGREQIYAKLTDENDVPITDLPAGVEGIQVVHIPTFSGIGAEETRYDRGYQNALIGQGKPGDILRNLLLEVHQKGPKDWQALKQDVSSIFRYELLDPIYAAQTDTSIVVEYKDAGSSTRPSFDIASAGSGFHQVLTLLSFFYARPASILLLDEPDAHQHVVLQRQVFDRLRQVARLRGCQLLVSTHSEIILEDTEPQQLISFYGAPHRLKIKPERDHVREALKRLSSGDILSAENGAHILYLEDESDFRLLRAFATVLGHRSISFFENPFFYPMRGRKIAEAKAHFFALKAIAPEIKGMLLLDGDNREVPDQEIAADGLSILRWKRYEIESYLVVPEALYRFVLASLPLFHSANQETGKKYLEAQLPPTVLADPSGDHEFLVRVPASKTLLPGFFKAAQCDLAKKDYSLLAARMKPEEIHPEIIEKLDAIAESLLPSLL